MNATRDISLLLADVDGTLVTGDKVLTAAAKEAARECARRASRLPLPAAGRHGG